MLTFDRVLLVQVITSHLIVGFSYMWLLIGVATILQPNVVGVLYLILEGLYRTVISYRTVTYDVLIAMPIRQFLIPGTVVDTDKKFNRTHVMWCYVIASLEIVLLLCPICKVNIIFKLALAKALCMLVSEIMMVLIIDNVWESKYLSTQMGIEFVNHFTVPVSDTKHTFRVANLHHGVEHFQIQLSNQNRRLVEKAQEQALIAKSLTQSTVYHFHSPKLTRNSAQQLGSLVEPTLQEPTLHEPTPQEHGDSVEKLEELKKVKLKNIFGRNDCRCVQGQGLCNSCEHWQSLCDILFS